MNGKSLININNRIKHLIKERILNTKNNRVYVQDSELVKHTHIKPGVMLKWTANKSQGKLVLKPSKEGTIRVAKRQRKDYVGSVIDIRNKAILDTFSDFEKLKLEIYEDEIIITGIDEAKVNENIASKPISFIDKKAELRISATELEKQYNSILARCSGESYISNSSYIQRMNANVTEVANVMARSSFVAGPYTTEKVIKANENFIRFNSVCAGAGILDKGFIDNGFKPQWALEIEKDMCDTYRLNLGDHIIQGDLSTYPISEVPDAEVFIGGPPCQDYSNANRVTGKIIDSPKNLLIRNFINIAKSMKSLKVFVMENVPQLLTKGKKFVDELKETLSDFEITIKKVDSSKYGCAQKRERAIIIGSKIGKIDLPEYTLGPVRTVRQALKGITESTPNQQDYSKSSEISIERMKYVPQGGNFRDIPENLRTKGTHSNLFYRLEWDNVCKTLTNVRKSMILHPIENRIISVREQARLTGLFPDEEGNEFIFTGSLANKQQMLANAVPLELSTVIAKTIKQKLIEYYNGEVMFGEV